MSASKLGDDWIVEVNGTVMIWEQTAQRAAEGGMDRWAIVADGIKAISLRGKVDTGEVKTLTTEHRAEAVDWVQKSQR